MVLTNGYVVNCLFYCMDSYSRIRNPLQSYIGLLIINLPIKLIIKVTKGILMPHTDGPRRNAPTTPPHFSLECPYCKGAVRHINSQEVYGRDHGMMYCCSNFPTCTAYVGCHKHDPTVPLGTLANQELRRVRMAVHQQLDPLWGKGVEGTTKKQRFKQRQRLYAQMLELCREFYPYHEWHVGWLDLPAAEQVLEILKQGARHCSTQETGAEYV